MRSTPTDEDDAFWIKTEQSLLQLSDVCRMLGLELLLETLVSSHGEIADDTTARVVQRVYGLGIKPDWWVVEAQPSLAVWNNIGNAIREHDTDCRGILTIARNVDGFIDVAKAAKSECLVKGFCAGRSIFGDTISAWMRCEISDVQAVNTMVTRFETVVAAWDHGCTTVKQGSISV